MDSNLKRYAKNAKERLKNGFWSRETRDTANAVYSVSTVSVEEDGNSSEQYSVDSYKQEQEFLNKVREINSSEKVVLNPLMLLADKDKMKAMTPQEKQTYLLKLSSKYAKALEKIREE